MTAPFSTVADLIEQALSQYPDRIAFSCLGHELTFAEVDRLSDQFASYLVNELKLVAGDRIAIQLPNIPQFPIVLYGAIRAGLTIVNTNPLYTPRELKHQLCDSGAKALVVLSNVADKAAEIINETDVANVIVTNLGDFLPQPKRLLVNFVVRYIKKMVPAFRFEKSIGFLQTLELGKAKTYQRVQSKAEDIFVLQYTGGTTGLSKGAVLTHANLCANADQICRQLPELFTGKQQVYCAPLPFYHIYAFNLHLLCAFLSGAKQILIPNPRDISSFAKALKSQNLTVFIGLNTLFNALLRDDEFRKLDFSTLTVTSAGGMALTPDVAKRWYDLTACEILEGYGLTETSPVIASNQVGRNKKGTVGVALADTEVKVVDENDQDLAVGEIGELCVKGPQVMSGYWQQPEETENVFLEGGWFKTGDIAVIDENGFIKLVDRKKDMIIVSGFNVYPNEIEEVVTQHPGIEEAAAIGVEHESNGQTIKLYVVLSNKNLSKDAIIDYCRQHLTAYKVPKLIEVCESLPKSNVGKILRRKLREKDEETNVS